MKKILCLILAMLMVLGLFAACSKGGDSSSKTEESSSAAEESAADEEEGGDEDADASESPAEDGSVTEITWYRDRLAYPNITDWGDELWVQELEARTGVQITFEGPNSGDDYAQAVNILLANPDDLPDLLYNNWNNYQGGLAAAIADGIVVDISANEDYKALVPNWFNMLESNPGLYASVTLDDGTSALFCHVENNLKRAAYQGLIIRGDWLEAVNMEAPETIDDLYAVLKAFKEQDANGNGDTGDEIPLTDDSGKGALGAIMTAWGLRSDTMYPSADDGKVTYWTEYKDGEPFKDFLKTMQTWYSEGLIDQEFASQDDSQKQAKITNDTAGLYFGYTANFAQWHEAIVTYTGKDTEAVNLLGIENPAGESGKHFSENDALNRPAASNEGTCVMKTAEDNGKIEAILKMIDYMYSDEGGELISWGVEGVSYEIDSEGNHVWTDTVLNDPEYSFTDKVIEYAIPTRGGWPKVMSYDAWASVEVTTDESHVGHDAWYACDASLCMPRLMLSEEEANEYNQIMTDASTAVNETYVNYILGQADDAAVDTMLSNIESLGVARAIEIYQGAYDRYLSKAESGME